jgi:N6-L-threonylcarbamoyladenine synthase
MIEWGASGVTLGIETSCDETAAAVVIGGGDIRSSVVASQVDVHATFGGVVPELASRAHLEVLTVVVQRALEEAGLTFQAPEVPAIDAVAATVGPGLVGSLLVGVSEAKALALAWGLPFVGLLVSGGHTVLISMEGPGRYRQLGQTLDDAAGEAFDKVARFLGLGYPGGPAIEAAAASGDPQAFAFPRAMLDEGLDLSFSGLKTAVVHAVRRSPEASNADVAASFQQAVVDVLVAKALRGAEDVGAGGLCLAGGVAANELLRASLSAACEELRLPVYVPSLAMCTDNAAMVAAAGWFQLRQRGPSPLDTGAQPNLRLPLLP